MPVSLFDPLRRLRVDLRAYASIGQDGGLHIEFQGKVLPHERKKALAIARAYEKLIRLQLENGGASVQKLLAQGKIRIESGRYVASTRLARE